MKLVYTSLALLLVIAEREPLFVYDRLLADRAGRRRTHCLYLPLAICTEVPALANDPFRDPDDLYTVLGEHYGELSWTEHVHARMPVPDEITSLKTPDNAPILVTRRVTRTPDGRPLALEETRLSADDTQLTYTLTADTRDTPEETTTEIGIGD